MIASRASDVLAVGCVPGGRNDVRQPGRDQSLAPGGSATGPAGAVMYWHVDDVKAALEKLLSMGAKEYQPYTERGMGFITASVVDPFGNILGVMYNPHYLEVLAGGATHLAT